MCFEVFRWIGWSLPLEMRITATTDPNDTAPGIGRGGTWRGREVVARRSEDRPAGNADQAAGRERMLRTIRSPWR